MSSDMPQRARHNPSKYINNSEAEIPEGGEVSPRDRSDSKVPTPAENRLSSGSDVFANGSGSEPENNGFGGFGTEAELGPEGATTADGVVKKVKKKSDKKPVRKVVVDDFGMVRILGKGKGGASRVFLAEYRASSELYALKAITKRHVLAHQELQHTLTEQAVLKRIARESRDPFVVKLWWSFHDKENLFLVMDFHPGGDLATQLVRWGRLGRDRARFYAAEIVEGCEGLHAVGVIYRGLEPKNILIGADGHIVLTDFGLSKEFPRKTTSQSPTAPPTPNGQTAFVTTPRWMDATGLPGRTSTAKRLDRDMTTTFCGTAEYLAPEVIQGLPYSYEVDWWSFGTMLYEMLTGVTPFWANNHSDMYVRVLQDELQFPDDKAMDQDTKDLIRGLLQRNPALRMCEPRVKKHPYFSMFDWQHVYYKRYIPPYIPPIDPLNMGDTQNFDDAFLDMEPITADETDHTDSEREDSDSESARTASGGKSPKRPPVEESEETVDVFDGYSSKGRDSILIYDEVDEDDEEDEHEVEDERIRGAEVLEPMAGAGPITTDEETTPHTTPVDLPEAEREPITPTTPTAEVPQPLAEVKPVASPAKPKSPAPAPVYVAVAVPAPAPTPTPEPSTSAARAKQKREKTGITELDRVLDAGTDDDWDLVERPKRVEAAYNWRTDKSGNNLFARGAVDRYRSTEFREASHPALSTEGSPSPSPSDSKRRGRSAGLSIRKRTRQFSRAKAPSASTVLNNGSGLFNPASSAPAVPSLKSKSSALSGASPTSPGSSDPSIAETPSTTPGPSGSQSAGELMDSDTLRRMAAVPQPPVDETKKSKKAKKARNKMLSLLTFDKKKSATPASIGVTPMKVGLEPGLDIVPFIPLTLSSSSKHASTSSSLEFPIEVGHDNYQLREDEDSRGVSRQIHSKSNLQGVEMSGMNDHIQSLSDGSMPCVRSNEMTSLEMFECLIAHGCSDLRAYIHPDQFSSCRAAEGAFGDVWKGKLIDGTDVAIKVLRYALFCDDGSKNMKRVMREIYNWSKLDHKNIHKLLGVTMFQGRLGMVSIWMEHGTLQEYLKQHSNADRHALCCQIAEGVAYLHSVSMIHGDLKAGNILVSVDGILKLTDFDYSIISGHSLAFSATTRTGGGTLRWMAPELVLATDEDPAERSKQTDVYALGMTILASEIITNTVPYSECRQDHQIYGKHTRKEHPRRSMKYFPDGWRGNRMWNFLVKCWSYDPTSRPTANDVLGFLWTDGVAIFTF